MIPMIPDLGGGVLILNQKSETVEQRQLCTKTLLLLEGILYGKKKRRQSQKQTEVGGNSHNLM